MGLVSFALTALPLLSWARDEFLSAYWQEKLKIPRLLPHWHWWIWVIVGLSALIFVLLESAYRVVREIEEGTEKENAALLGEIRKANEKLASGESGRAKNERPEFQVQFDYGYQQATLSVTNNGAIAEVWASLRIEGLMYGKKQGMFARWVNTDAEKVKIAKGETRNLVLAFRRLSNTNDHMSQWEIYCAGDALHSVMPAHYTNMIGNEGATPDIHLYVKVFSDPDCIELPRERHIVLHANRAEELSD